MSVSLTVNWRDGLVESVPVAGQAAASTLWRQLGIELGLRWVPMFSDWVPVEPGNLDEIIREVRAVRAAAAGRDGFTSVGDDAARLVEGLERLRLQTGWSASIG